MGDLLKELLARYGFRSLGAVAIIAVLVAATVHYLAAPGEVRLLYGLAQYTKGGGPDSDLQRCEAALQGARDLKELSAELAQTESALDELSVEQEEIERRISAEQRTIPSNPARREELERWQAKQSKSTRDRADLEKRRERLWERIAAAQDTLCSP